jgi:hypothetical protein
MQKNTLFRFLLTGALALWLAAGNLALGQGLTTAGISGFVVDAQGTPVSGATVTITHEPSGTRATAITRANGQFSQSGLRVGGPYTITAAAEGYTIGSVNGVQATLGDATNVMLSAQKQDVVTLEAYSVTASTSDLDSNTTGAGSVLDNRGITNQPTTNRSFADMIKTNPFTSIRSGAQVTALGMNNRYNSISVDGARINDNFGLSSTGLFSLKNPFSLDALENFSIALTPYDVTQSGFAGASVNAVSKSGTNEFHGSAYYYYTSDKWQGADVFGTTAGQRTTSFYDRTWGATLGGPIIKDKLFFFVNYEKVSNPSGGAPTPGFQPNSTELSALTSQFASLPGSPDFGTFGSASAALVEDEKKLVKLDWNISNDHRLTARYSETVGNQPSYPDFRSSGSPSSMPTLSPAPSYSNGVTTFDSKYYNLAVNEEVWAAQLFSNWTPNLKTEISYSKNDTTSLRSTPDNLPEIVLLNFPGTSVATGGSVTSNTALLFGTDYSSMGNGVIASTTGYGGNATYSWKDFTFKVGFDREETDFENLFRNGSYGRFVYNYTSGFNLATATPLAFVRNVSSAGFPGTDISTFDQTGFFAQAKWEPNPQLNVTFGLRYDMLGQPIAPTYNPAIETAFGVRNDGTLDGAEQLAPRLSFNYAVDPDRKVQLRGGVGVFLGRSPWVWMSNSYGNAGLGRGTTTITSGAIPTLAQYLGGTFSDTNPIYKFDPANPLGTTNGVFSGGNIAFATPDIKPPTNLRGNFAVDYKAPFLDSIFTVEYIHTDVMEAFFYRNYNLVAVGTGADGRTRFSGRKSTAFNVASVVGNTSVGSSDYIAFSLARPFKDNWSYSATYTHGRATEVQPAGSSTATSQLQFNVVFNQGLEEETRSDYETRHRFQFTLGREFNFFKRFKTTASLYYEGRSGVPYSYVYASDLNGDGYSQNDAVAVPGGANDPRFDFSGLSNAQRDAYLDYMLRGELGEFANGYAPRNSFIGPWQNRLDLHISQEVKVVGPVKVELFADFINFGSWLSKDLFNYIDTLGSPGNSNQIVVLNNARYGADGRIQVSAYNAVFANPSNPGQRQTIVQYTDTPTGAVVSGVSYTQFVSRSDYSIPTASQFLTNNGESRWRVQAGVRLKF